LKSEKVSLMTRASTTNNFEVISISVDGNCSFRAISYCLYGTQNEHYAVRSTTVAHIAKKWRAYKNFIVGD